MTVTNTLIWDSTQIIDQKFIASFTTSSPIGTGIKRDDIQNIPHSSSDYGNHPTLNNVVKGGRNYLLASGSATCSVTWEGDDNPPSSDDVDAYISYLLSDENGLNMGIENIVKTPVSLSIDLIANKEETSGPHSVFMPYLLKSSKAEITVLEENTYLVCLLRQGNAPQDWNFVEYNVAAGERITINKQGNECYLLICSPSFIIGSTEVMVRNTPLYVGGTELADRSIKNLQSSSVNLLNKGTTAAKIGMLYK